MKNAGTITIILLLSMFLAACESEPGPDGGVVPQTFISGTIVPQAGQSVDVAGVSLTLTGDKLTIPLTTTLGADGKYSFPEVKPGAYKLYPSKAGLRFSPVFQSITMVADKPVVQEFTASKQTAATFKVSGNVTSPSTSVDVSGVLLTLTGGPTSTLHPVTSGSDGTYIIEGVLAGKYILQPFKADLTFEPKTQTITISPNQVPTTPLAAKNFVASGIPYTISGLIKTTTGQSLVGVSLKLTGGALTTPLRATSTSDGKYTFTTKVPNGTYQVQPSKAGLEFMPAVATVVVADADISVEDLFAYAAPFTCDTSGWCRPLATALSASLNKSIYRIWAASGTDVWFVGAGGTVLRYASPAADQIPGWTQQNAGATNDLYSIWGSSANDVWVAGAGGGKVYHYVSGASPEWTAVTAPSTTEASKQDINALWGTSSTGVVQYAGCMDSAGNFAPDGGDWKQVLAVQGRNTYSGWASSPTDQWIVGRLSNTGTGNGVSGPLGRVGAQGAMSRMQSDGKWEMVTSASSKPWTAELATALDSAWFGDIQGTSENNIWAVGTKGLVAHFDGAKWNLFDAGVGATNLYGVWAVSATEVWFAGGDPTTSTGKLVKSTYAGTTWTSQNIPNVPSDAGVLYRVYVDSATSSVWLGSATGILRYKP